MPGKREVNFSSLRDLPHPPGQYPQLSKKQIPSGKAQTTAGDNTLLIQKPLLLPFIISKAYASCTYPSAYFNSLC